MRTRAKLNYSVINFRSMVFAALALSSAPLFADHPVCKTEIAGVTLDNSQEQVETTLQTAGLVDISCLQKMNMSCKKQRQQEVRYSSNPSGHLEAVEDKIVTLGVDQKTGKSVMLGIKVRIDAPEKLETFDDDRDWSEWSHASLIQSKIAEYCGSTLPDGIIAHCEHVQGVKITVIAGSSGSPECRYIFEARHGHFKGPYVSTNSDHAIIESLSR